MKSTRDITKTIQLEGVSAEVDNGIVTVKGEKGESSRNFFDPEVTITREDDMIKVTSIKRSKNQKKRINSIASHIKNMVRGAKEGFVYSMKICSSHFPMNVTFKNNVLEVKNFLGEKKARQVEIPESVSLKVQGENISVESVDLEKAGQIASAIEQLCRISNKDRRIFQDGIYITKKAK